MEKITVTIETDPVMMEKIKRFLAWLYLNSHWGHSGTVALSCDGDGADKVIVSGFDCEELRDYINKLSRKTMKVEYINAE